MEDRVNAPLEAPPRVFGPDEGGAARAEVTAFAREISRRLRSEPESAPAIAVAWIVGLPDALAHVDDPGGALARALDRALGGIARGLAGIARAGIVDARGGDEDPPTAASATPPTSASTSAPTSASVSPPTCASTSASTSASATAPTSASATSASADTTAITDRHGRPP
ncbi:MAG: hypothetical protein R3B09_20710 [Nannocystaceae bacterium]